MVCLQTGFRILHEWRGLEATFGARGRRHIWLARRETHLSSREYRVGCSWLAKWHHTCPASETRTKEKITKLTHLTKGRSIDCEVGVASVWEEHLLRPWNLQRKEKRRARPTTYRCSLYRHCPSPLSVCGPGGSRYLPHSQQYGVECCLDFRGIVCEVIDDTQCLHDGRSHQQELIVLVSGETILAVSDVVRCHIQSNSM